MDAHGRIVLRKLASGLRHTLMGELQTIQFLAELGARGVRIAGLTHPGLMGCLPSHELLGEWNRREAPLAKLGLAKPPAEEDVVVFDADRVCAELLRRGLQ